MKKRIWVISEVYRPDEVGGAYFMSHLAEGLAEKYQVNVLCGYPNHDARNAKVEGKEFINGVDVERCSATRFNKKISVFCANISLS